MTGTERPRASGTPRAFIPGQSGVQLCKELEACADLWPVNVDLVHATLLRLEREGLLESDGTREEYPQEG
jgi:hypothetical protein